MLKIAVCDDEEFYREMLRDKIAAYAALEQEECEIYLFPSGNDFLRLGAEVSDYAIVFMDINMEEMDGVETAHRLRQLSKTPYLVFVTAYISYAIEGYKVNAIRYLLKGDANFDAALGECLNTIFQKIHLQMSVVTFQFIQGERQLNPYQIVYVESRLHKLEFTMKNQKGPSEELYAKLGEVEEQLCPYGFIRVHQSFLVNSQCITMIRNYRLQLSTGEEIPISKAKYRQVKEAFIAAKGAL